MSNKTVPLTEVYSAYTQPLEPQILEEIPKKKWAAITALVLSLIAFFTGILVIGFVPAIFAIVFAGIALGQVKKGEAEGAGMAIGSGSGMATGSGTTIGSGAGMLVGCGAGAGIVSGAGTVAGLGTTGAAGTAGAARRDVDALLSGAGTGAG